MTGSHLTSRDYLADLARNAIANGGDYEAGVFIAPDGPYRVTVTAELAPKPRQFTILFNRKTGGEVVRQNFTGATVPLPRGWAIEDVEIVRAVEQLP